MNNEDKYGVVYTPDSLADFVAQILIEEIEIREDENVSILDPACGEGSLLKAIKRKMDKNTFTLYGIDVDEEVILKNNSQHSVGHTFIHEDAILPKISKKNTIKYWNEVLPEISLIIANPPWSAEKIYQKEELEEAGFNFGVGQYDSYVLFIELAYNLLCDNGYFAFIIPDSIFSGENETVRKFLCENTEIKVIARLGEKLFENVNRATTVIIARKKRPIDISIIKCFRLNTNQRKRYLNGEKTLYEMYDVSKHSVKQSRFAKNNKYLFDVDTREIDEELLRQIENDKTDWNEIFYFGRGVEISKTGNIVTCSFCKQAQGYSKKHLTVGVKKCSGCGKEISVNNEVIDTIIEEYEQIGLKKIYVGENIKRYGISGHKYIKLNVNGIDYKNPQIYVPPKILIRKTGLGIYACIDYDSTLISQTVYSCNYIDENNQVPMEYYLALLNSRVIYYYYLKIYGENEWKSHPYFTKSIIFTLPIKRYMEGELSEKIISKAKKLNVCYNREEDLELENLIEKLYGISSKQSEIIRAEMSNLPNLSAINNMKF